MHGAYCDSFSFKTQGIFIITAKQIGKNKKEIVAFINKALEIRFNYFASPSGIQQNFQKASLRDSLPFLYSLKNFLFFGT